MLLQTVTKQNVSGASSTIAVWPWEFHLPWGHPAVLTGGAWTASASGWRSARRLRGSRGSTGVGEDGHSGRTARQLAASESKSQSGDRHLKHIVHLNGSMECLNSYLKFLLNFRVKFSKESPLWILPYLPYLVLSN